MELIVNPQPLIGPHIHHPCFHGPPTILYPGKNSPWQPVVTTLPSLPLEVPKESIIAHTDFTTTSLIAKRRLSSKKRKKLQGGSGETTHSDPSTPMDSSPDNSNPWVSSTTHTPPTTDERRHETGIPMSDSTHPHLCSHGTSSAQSSSLTTTTATSDVARMSYQHTHHMAPRATMGAAELRAFPRGEQNRRQFTSVGPVSNVQVHVVASTASNSGGYTVVPTTEGLVHKQFTNPMLNQLQQELNMRFLQEQSGMGIHPAAFTNVPYATTGQVPHPQPVAERNQGVEVSRGPSVSVAGGGSMSAPNASGFKWCRAHIIIARQIQQHQHQAKNAVAVPQRPKELPMSGPHPQHLNGHTPPQQDTAVAQMAVAQQLALLQMYGIQPSTAMPTGGYMATAAVPSYSLQDLHMRMQSYAPTLPGAPGAALVANAGISLVKPAAGMPTVVDSNSMSLVNGLHLQAPFAQSMPVAATLAPSDLNTAAVMHGPQGSWVGPVPVFGSCIVNPFPPGMMATSWVK